MKDTRIHVVFSGGGTAGHLFPGLAVGQRLVEQMPQVRITFVGSGRPLERREVAAAGFEYLALPSRPMPQRPRELFACLVENLAGYLAARRVLLEDPCAVVVGLGGYASVPMAAAAIRCRVPLVLLEQNAVPGRATRWLARSAAAVCTAFEQTRSGLPSRCKVRVTGNPIRPGFDRPLATPGAWCAAGGRYPQPMTDQSCADKQLLILGGSGGARSLNEHVPRALEKVRSRLDGWRIVHQSGHPGFEATRQLYHKLGIAAHVAPFVSDMPNVLSASHLAVCRAGGTTLAELAAAGVPAVLVPYPHAADDHQRKNADLVEASGACITCDERQVRGRLDDCLAHAVSDLLAEPEKRIQMSAAMRRLARPNAASDVAAVIGELALGTTF